MHIERMNDDPGYDPNWTPPGYGLRIGDYQLLDLIEEVETLYGRERDPFEPLTAIEQAAIDLTSAFWDDEVWVVVYEMDQGYGGPEEGGWYYTVYEKVSAHKIGGDSWAEIIPQAYTAAAIYSDYYHNQEFGQYGSVLPGSYVRYDVRIEIVPQDQEPGKLEQNQRRPVYC